MRKEILTYHPWNKEHLTTLLDDIKKYTPKLIVIFAGEEWEVGGMFRGENFIKDLEYLLIQYDIKIKMVFGSANKEFYNTHTTLPKVNAEIILWPMYWVFHTYYNLIEKNVFFNKKNIEQIEKLYISLNNKPHSHRCELMDKIVGNDLLEYGYVSWIDKTNDFEKFRPYVFKNWKPEQLILDKKYEENLDSYITLPDEYFKTLVNVIPESCVNVPFITEKTITAILFEKPFIVLGGKGIHKTLTDHGFVLYDELFDYSFDLNDDYHERIDSIIQNLNKLKDVDYNELWDKIKLKTQYNKLVATRIVRNRKHIPQFIIDFNKDYPEITEKYFFKKFL